MVPLPPLSFSQIIFTFSLERNDLDKGIILIDKYISFEKSVFCRLNIVHIVHIVIRYILIIVYYMYIYNVSIFYLQIYIHINEYVTYLFELIQNSIFQVIFFVKFFFIKIYDTYVTTHIITRILRIKNKGTEKKNTYTK